MQASAGASLAAFTTRRAPPICAAQPTRRVSSVRARLFSVRFRFRFRFRFRCRCRCHCRSLRSWVCKASSARISWQSPPTARLASCTARLAGAPRTCQGAAVQHPLPLETASGQSVVGASHRRAAPRSQGVAGSIRLPGRSLLALLHRHRGCRCRRLLAQGLPAVLSLAKSRSVWHAQPNPSFKRTCLRQAA